MSKRSKACDISQKVKKESMGKRQSLLHNMWKSLCYAKRSLY